MRIVHTAWDAFTGFLQWANGYGIPIPVIAAAVIFYVFLRRGMKWSSRQSYYIDMLKQLGIWEDTLADRLDYCREPDSPYQADPDNEHFRGLVSKGYKAFTAFKELLPMARIFLSVESMRDLDHLISEHWSIKEFETASEADYLQRTSEEVKAAYAKLLGHAKADFKRSQYLQVVRSLRPAAK